MIAWRISLSRYEALFCWSKPRSIKAKGLFPQRSPCSSSHKSYLSSGATALIHSISYSLWTPFRPPTPNNIHCFLTLKKEHPFWSILDLGGQIFGLERCSLCMIKMIMLSINYHFIMKHSLQKADNDLLLVNHLLKLYRSISQILGCQVVKNPTCRCLSIWFGNDVGYI